MINSHTGDKKPLWFDFVKERLAVGNEDQELVCDLAELKENSSKLTMSVFPEKVTFETQESDEQVVMTMRRATVTNSRWIFIAFVMSISPIFIWSLEVFTSWLSPEQSFFVLMLWELVVLGYVIEQLMLWYYNLYIVTDRRIVDVDFRGLLTREMNDADLIKIQDVTVKSQGVLAAIFHYGDLLIQTAAEITVFEFSKVSFPEKVASVIRLLATNREKIDNNRGNQI